MARQDEITSMFKAVRDEVYDAMVEAEINIHGCVSFSEIQQKVAETFNCDVDDIF